MSHTLAELDQQIRKAGEKIEIGGIYFHYKRPENFYVIESIGFIEASEEVCVIYRALYDKGLVWVRTLENFLEVTESGERFIKVK